MIPYQTLKSKTAHCCKTEEGECYSVADAPELLHKKHDNPRSIIEVNFCPYCGFNPREQSQSKTKARIIIVGAGGSGKDYLKKQFIKKGFTPDVSYTSRSPREGEKDGRDYHFVSKEKFEQMIKSDCFYEHQMFKDNYYGTTLEAFKICDVFIMTPPAIDSMSKAMRESSFVIYLSISEMIRSKRLSLRGDMKEVRRRIMVDREMFDSWTNYDMIITDPLF